MGASSTANTTKLNGKGHTQRENTLLNKNE